MGRRLKIGTNRPKLGRIGLGQIGFETNWFVSIDNRQTNRRYKNKRPTRPHIVHLSTMCNLFDRSSRGPFLFTYWCEKHQLDRGGWDLASCKVEFCSVVSEQKLKIFQQIRGRGGHLVFPMGPKNTNLVEDVEILPPVKFCWNRFSGFRGKVNNVSANQRPGRPSCFSDRPWLLLVVLRIYFAFAIFQPYRDLEAGDNQSLKS